LSFDRDPCCKNRFDAQWEEEDDDDADGDIEIGGGAGDDDGEGNEDGGMVRRKTWLKY
jgi:hypothetical protein